MVNDGRRKRRRVTAEELIQELQQDSEYQGHVADRRRFLEARRGRDIAERRAAAEPLVRELQQRGYPIAGVGDLVSGRVDYRAAIPVLLQWLPAVQDVRVREDLVRALTIPAARGVAGPALIQEFRRESSSDSLRWAVGNALAEVADARVFNELAELAEDRRYGRAREMLALALARAGRPAAVDVLRRLLHDPDVAGHAVVALGRLGAAEAREDLEACLQDRRGWVRREARKALARIDRARGAVAPIVPGVPRG